MDATISFFPVGNGDMTLVATESGLKLLIGTSRGRSLISSVVGLR